MNQKKLSQRRKRHEFLLTFFDSEPKYQVKEVNGYILVKYFSNASNEWEVMIYTENSYNKAQEYMKVNPFE